MKLAQSQTKSFRDPHGHVLITDHHVLRFVKKEYEPQVISFMKSEIFFRLVEEGLLVRTQIAPAETLNDELSRDEALDGFDCGLVLEHEQIPFQTYPYEWPPEMLHEAGLLTLEVMERLLRHGFGLKDASPYNVLYHGYKPVFVDLLSIEPRDSLDSIWLPYAQFVRTFIQPLLVDKYFGVGLSQTLRINRDGLTPNDVARLCSPLQKMRPPFLTLVFLPALLSRIQPSAHRNFYGKRQAKSPEQARFILNRQLKGLRRKLNAVRPNAVRQSAWTEYLQESNYAEEYLSAKQQFVETVISNRKPKSVLDVGCNEGYFSAIAAENGASVVAIDRDPTVVGRTWRKALANNSNILPLVIDLTRPTPALGWRNSECLAFLDRACGAFDCVLMLAVLHHMLVSERIPLQEIMRLAADLTTNLLIVEYLSPDDPMFRLITRGNSHLYESLTREEFEFVSKKYFVIEQSKQVWPSQRWMYLMRRARHA